MTISDHVRNVPPHVNNAGRYLFPTFSREEVAMTHCCLQAHTVHGHQRRSNQRVQRYFFPFLKNQVARRTPQQHLRPFSPSIQPSLLTPPKHHQLSPDDSTWFYGFGAGFHCSSPPSFLRVVISVPSKAPNLGQPIRVTRVLHTRRLFVQSYHPLDIIRKNKIRAGFDRGTITA